MNKNLTAAERALLTAREEAALERDRLPTGEDYADAARAVVAVAAQLAARAEPPEPRTDIEQAVLVEAVAWLLSRYVPKDLTRPQAARGYANRAFAGHWEPWDRRGLPRPGAAVRR